MKQILFVVAVIAVFALVAGAVFTGITPLSLFGDGEYHTGFSMDDVHNCDTISKKQGCWTTPAGKLGCWYGNVEKDYPEIIQTPMNNAPVVTSMKTGTGARSIDVTCYGTLTYVGIPTTYWTPEWGWYKVQIKYDKLGAWNTIINTKNNQVDEDIVGMVSGSRKKQHYHNWQVGPVIPGFGSPYISKHLSPITFNIKNPQVGILRVIQYAEFTALFGALRETKVCSMDYAFLISGKGTVDLVDEQSRYIAGEDTVRFKCDTGYSGYTQGGTYNSRGWELKIYDPKGNKVKQWDIDDDKRGTRYDSSNNILNYDIPADVVEPGTSHTFRVVLTNTLFDQDYEEFFSITREELEQAPDIKPITFGADEYRLGDTVIVYLEGIPNPKGRNNVDGFLVNILYGTSGTDYVKDYYLKYVSATGNKATISFRASKGDTYVTVEAWAFDQPEQDGGIMSEGEKEQIWIKDKESSPAIDETHWLVFVIPLIVFILFLVASFFVPGGVYTKIIVIIIGIILAVALFIYLRANIEDILMGLGQIAPVWIVGLFKWRKG